MADPSPPSNQGPTCSPLEQEVLDEYALLLANLNKVRSAAASPQFRVEMKKGLPTYLVIAI